MRKLLVMLVFVVNNLQAQVYVASAERDKDQTKIIQAAFNNPATKFVSINTADVVISGTVNIPEGKMLSFEHGFKIIGKGTINGGIIDANYQSQIFDTSINVNPRSVNQYFSVKWFGAKGNNTDDYAIIQKTINTCLRNNIRTVYFPVGRYKISHPLIIRGTSGAFCTLELLGESSFWDSNTGSEIATTFKNTFAIGIQDGKGCKVRKLTIAGLFTPPSMNDSH
ncbi:MAG: glycosyl hydrolase family 28-related protein, partial [Ginsengibacter sp.]